MSDDPTHTSVDAPADEPKRGATQKLLDGIERLGNRVPHPAIIFLALCAIVIVLSAVLAAFDISATSEVAKPAPVEAEVNYPAGSSVEQDVLPPPGYDGGDEDVEIVTETIEIESLLSADGVRFLFTSTVSNFNNFGVVGVILVAMIGVGVAEQAGLIAALIRKLVKVSPPKTITFIIVFLGIVSSVASDAGYLVLIPLGAAAFVSIGRHPLAGLAAAYAGVSAAFGVNILITPTDGLITEITNEAAALVDPDATVDLTANLWFSIVSTLFLAIVISLVTTKVVEPRLGVFDGEIADDTQPAVEVDAEAESRGLRYALYGLLASIAVVLALTLPSGAPLRDPETGDIIGDSPLMAGLIFIITLIFLVMGMCYGRGAGTLTTSVAAIEAITKTFAGLSGLIFLLLIISQFIAYFNFSNMPQVAAVKLADLLESADIGALWLLIGFVLVTILLNLIIPGVVPKWAIFAPIFVPLFIRLDVAPQTVLAAYRIGDSPTNVITPLMVYLPLIVLVAQRYKKDAGVGTIVSLMIPYTVVVAIAWTALFVVWYLLGIPLGPGYPVKL